MKTPKEFVDQYTGRNIDIDGVYGTQCVDGFKAFLLWAGIPIRPTPNNWAEGYWTCLDGNGKPVQSLIDWENKYFDQIEPSKVRNGDWCIWLKGSSCELSHISMYYNGKYFGERQIVNDPSFSLVNLQADFAGALRWKGWNMITLKDGYQELKYNGQSILVYLQSDEKIGMLSAGTNGHTTAPIELIDDDRVHYCKTNASYFQMSQTADDPYGTVYGVVQSFNYSQEPKQGKFLVYALKNDGSVVMCNDVDYWLTKADVQFAVSPAVVMLKDGMDTELLSPAIGSDKITNANTQTLLVRMDSGKFALVCVIGKLNLYDCRAWCKSIGASDMIALDGGGSTQMHTAERLYSTGRAIPNVLTLYKDKTHTDSDTSDSSVIPGEDEYIIVDDEKPLEIPVSSGDYLFKMSDKMYDALKFFVNIMPLIVVLYCSLADTWGLPFSKEIVATISAITVFVNSILNQSSIGYQKEKKE